MVRLESDQRRCSDGDPVSQQRSASDRWGFSETAKTDRWGKSIGPHLDWVSRFDGLAAHEGIEADRWSLVYLADV